MTQYHDPATFENGELTAELPQRVLDAVKAKPAESLADPDAAKADFEAAMRTRGIIPPKGGVLGDGKFRRCDVDAEGNRGRGDGAYVLFLDGLPAGGLQNWRDGRGWENWRADLGRELTPSEREEYRKKMDDARVQREADKVARQAHAEKQAVAQISRSAYASDDHPYLIAKGVKASGAYYSEAPIKISPWRASSPNVLLIPVRDIAGNLISLQIIDPEGNKHFLYGGRVSACYFPIGDFSAQGILCVAEGFATGASIFEATGHPTAVAFNSGNLTPVAKALQQKYPHASIVVCADDDAWTDGNPGVTDATKAAESVDGVVAVPVFENRQEDETDFNDLHAAFGLDVVREQINAVLKRSATSASNPAQPKGREPVKPEPLPDGLPPVDAFDFELLPDSLRSYAEDIVTTMQAPPDFAGVPIMTGLGAVIGRKIGIRPQRNTAWTEVPNLWALLIGRPGILKSPTV
jgi:putative DNA primase/helicase